MLTDHPEKLESIFHLIYETMQLPFAFINPRGEVQVTIPYRPLGSFAFPDMAGLLEQLRWEEVSALQPVIRVLENTETYILIKLVQEESWLGTMIIGPIMQYEVTEATVDTFLREQQISRRRANEALHYYARQAVNTYRKIQQTALLLYYLTYGVRIDMEALAEGNGRTIECCELELDRVIETSLSVNRQREFYHHSFAAQSAIFDSVREGDLDKLRDTLNASMDGERGILCKSNPLRNQKNFAICGTALATRSAIEGGVDSEIAFTLSDRYIQQFEDLSDIHQVANMHHRMLFELTELVHKIQSSKFSYVVKQCKAYIATHLMEDIDYNLLAKQFTLNKHYLAEVFKQEMAITIGDYIQKERIEEAKRMLANPDYTLLDIAQMLRFFDQSHFTRTFKKWCGITPKQFRIRRG